SVTIDVLANEMDFLVTESSQPVYFVDYLHRAAAFFAPPRIRNNAEGTKLIAAFNDWNKRHVGRTSLCGRDVPNFAFLTLIQIYHCRFPALRAFNQRRDPIGSLRPD